MHDSLLTGEDNFDLDLVVESSLPLPPKSDKEIISELLDRLNDNELEKLIDEINDEKMLRKLRKERMDKLKNELKNEKNRLLKEINSLKIKMLKNIPSDDDEESSDGELTVKKPAKKSVKKKRK